MILSELNTLLKTSLSNYYNNNHETTVAVQRILTLLTGFSRSELITHSNQEINVTPEHISQIINRIKKSEPLEYIFNNAGFINLELFTDSAVLIPRPETEELAVLISNYLQNKSNKKILDIGTGSGCISIYLALQNPNNKYFACDISAKAINTATRNTQKYQTKNIELFVADIFNYNNNNVLKNTIFDIIVSNPPYVTNSEKLHIQPNVLNYEPHNALFVDDNNPLCFYKQISEYAFTHLSSNGKLYFEINEQFGQQTANLIKSIGFKQVNIHKDLFNKERFIECIHL